VIEMIALTIQDHQAWMAPVALFLVVAGLVKAFARMKGR